jgi:hypothetical protein
MKKSIFILSAIAALTGCGNNSGKNKQPGGDTGINNPEQVKKDTLPDAAYFEYKVDGNTYTIDSTDIGINYTDSDSTLTIAAGKRDGDRLNITIPDVKHTPGYRGNAWRSDNTKLAGSDSLIYQPTVTLYKNDGSLASWNNLSDGYHAPDPKDDNSIYIYAFRQTGTRNFIIKGWVTTKVLKNVYESGSKEFNKDHTVTADFVIPFEDYWLKL